VLRRFAAPAKLNLALVVGPRREDGKHEVATVLQRVDVCDRLTLEPAQTTRVDGFGGDTLVGRALALLADEADADGGWAVRLWKRIPVASGLGGGSSDAATALRVANGLLPRPLSEGRLAEVAGRVGSDVPFFLREGPQLGERDGSVLAPLDLPQDYWVVLILPHGARKASTADVYAAFDRRGGERGWDGRRTELLGALARVRRPRDFAAFPPNDLARSPFCGRLRALGAFRADVSGAGPVVYGLFHRLGVAREARSALSPFGRTWLTVPAWYG
jgi:4-diphosphocytidyl-2-C-methyl-D-erythritol kinase